MKHIIYLIIIILTTLFLTGCTQLSERQIISIDGNCMGQEEYDKNPVMKAKDVEDRLKISEDCNDFCYKKNASCYSYEIKGCNIIADETIYKCLSKEKEIKMLKTLKFSKLTQ